MFSDYSRDRRDSATKKNSYKDSYFSQKIDKTELPDSVATIAAIGAILFANFLTLGLIANRLVHSDLERKFSLREQMQSNPGLFVSYILLVALYPLGRGGSFVWAVAMGMGTVAEFVHSAVIRSYNRSVFQRASQEYFESNKRKIDQSSDKSSDNRIDDIIKLIKSDQNRFPTKSTLLIEILKTKSNAKVLEFGLKLPIKSLCNSPGP